MTIQADQINALLTKKIVQDLVIECTSTTQVVVKSGCAVGADDGSVIMEPASDLTLDITASGKNGLDTGAEAGDTWYYIYLIFNPSTEEVAGLLSASATSPTMPSGFTKKKVVGAVRNDSSSDFRQFQQVDEEVFCIEEQVLFNTTLSSTWSSFDLTSFIPSAISRTPKFCVESRYASPGTNGTLPKWVPLDLSSGTTPVGQRTVSVPDDASHENRGRPWYVIGSFMTTSTGRLSFREASGDVGNTTTRVYVQGFTLSL